MKTIWSPNYTAGHGERLWVVVHTAESSGSAEGLGNFFQNVSRNSSSHEGADNVERVQYVDYANSAWTLRSGNPISVNLENAGAYSAWSRDQWLSQPTRLELNAQWIAERCRADNIPCAKIGPAEVAAGHKGVIEHQDYTYGTGDGTHTDCGANYPWDIILPRAQQIYAGGTPPVLDGMELLMATAVPITFVRLRGTNPVFMCDWLMRRRPVPNMATLRGIVYQLGKSNIPSRGLTPIAAADGGTDWIAMEVDDLDAFGVLDLSDASA